MSIQKFKNTINQVKIKVPSNYKIQSWAKREQIVVFYLKSKKNITNKYLIKRTTFGEVTNSNIVKKIDNLYFFDNFGLFCEKIFGPLNNFSCFCNKNNIKDIFKECEKCNITITSSKIRKYRFGYIPLNIPVFNTLFFFSNFDFPKIFFNLKKKSFENLIYFNIDKEEYKNYIFKVENLISLIDKIKNMMFSNKKIRTVFNEKKNYIIKKEEELSNFLLNFEEEAVKLLYCIEEKNKKKLNKTLNEQFFDFLNNYNLLKELKIIHNKLIKIRSKSIEYKFYSKKLRILENFYNTKIKMSGLMFINLPVIPTIFRPYDKNKKNASSSSKLNFLYQNIIRINERLTKILDKSIPNKQIIILNEIRLLQESVDFLLDNNKINKNLVINNKPLKSLTDILKGKYGRYRKSILGKRINFSARSVIVVNPLLKINQSAVPFNILKNLFSFSLDRIIKKIKVNGFLTNENKNKIYLVILQKLIKNEVIMLNRAPTLHKLGLQVFNPIITKDDAIHLHPLVCSAYNADFDGDQMSVYLPLNKLSKIELNTLLKATKDLFLFGNSELKMKPTQELILALHYLSLNNEKIKYFNFGNYFNNYNEFFGFFIRKKLNIHTPIWINNSTKNKNIKLSNNFIRLNPGRIILNKILNKN